MSDQRRPSASLRTRRPSTVYNEVDEQGQGQGQVPPVPVVGDNHLTQYFQQQPQHQQQQRRPSAQHAESHESSGSGRQRGGHRGERGDRGAGTGPGAMGDAGDSSKVGARLLNKRQSVSFGKAMAAAARAGVRGGGGAGEDGYGGQVPPPPMPMPSSSSASRGYGDANANGRAQPPQGMQLAPGGGRRGATTEASAGEEMVHHGPRGPTGQPLHDLLREDFTADNCARLHLRSLLAHQWHF